MAVQDRQAAIFYTLGMIFARHDVVACSSCSTSLLAPGSRRAPVTSRLLGRSKYLNLTPRSLGQEKGTCSFGTGRFVITYPMLRPPGPARRCNQNEWFENSITLITSIKVSIRRGCSFTLRFSSFTVTRRICVEDFPISAKLTALFFFFIYILCVFVLYDTRVF